MQPVVFQSRWALSYLRGPLTREQIQTLMTPFKQARAATTAPSKPAPAAPEAAIAAVAKADSSAGATLGKCATVERPLIPPEAGECFVPVRGVSESGQPPVYRPTLIGAARLHFVDAKAGIDHWQDMVLIVPINKDPGDSVWEQAVPLSDEARQFDAQPAAGAAFAPAAAELLRGKSYAAWQKSLAAHLYRSETLKLWKAPAFKELSKPDESEADFRVRLQQRVREERDRAVEDLRQKYGTKGAKLEDQIRKAHERIDREKSQFNNQAVQAAVSIGSSILRAITGRKLASVTSVRGAASAANSAGRAAKQRGDVGRAEQELEALQDQHKELEVQLAGEVGRLDSATAEVELSEYPIRPKKTDIAVQKVALAWVPTAPR